MLAECLKICSSSILLPVAYKVYDSHNTTVLIWSLPPNRKWISSNQIYVSEDFTHLTSLLWIWFPCSKLALWCLLLYCLWLCDCFSLQELCFYLSSTDKHIRNLYVRVTLLYKMHFFISFYRTYALTEDFYFWGTIGCIETRCYWHQVHEEGNLACISVDGSVQDATVIDNLYTFTKKWSEDK